MGNVDWEWVLAAVMVVIGELWILMLERSDGDSRTAVDLVAGGVVVAAEERAADPEDVGTAG